MLWSRFSFIFILIIIDIIIISIFMLRCEINKQASSHVIPYMISLIPIRLVIQGQCCTPACSLTTIRAHAHPTGAIGEHVQLSRCTKWRHLLRERQDLAIAHGQLQCCGTSSAHSTPSRKGALLLVARQQHPCLHPRRPVLAKRRASRCHHSCSTPCRAKARPRSSAAWYCPELCSSEKMM